MNQHLSPPIQQRYMMQNAAAASSMIPAPAHMGLLPTSQSQVHLSTHPLPAHLPAFLHQGSAPQFAVTAGHAAYLTHAGMIGGLQPSAAAAAAAAAASSNMNRSNTQAAFHTYIYPGYD